VLLALDAEYAGGRSIDNLFLLANRMIGGEAIAGVSLSEINKACSAINEGFDHCRFLEGFADSFEKFSDADEPKFKYEVFPNPFGEKSNLIFMTSVDMKVNIEMYSSKGDKVGLLFNGPVEANTMYRIVVDATELTNGIYYCTIVAGDEVFQTRLAVSK
ncbi:MAG: T9SS type A sorting domain-containing protein, partial [Crocinitomicaceae bacterium]|nr:T9SS type A sorting domain-containing protein [Crocinitomicaceae bacterium]